MAIANLMKNAEHAQQVLVKAIGLIARAVPESIAHTALGSGLVTQPDAMGQHVKERLDVILCA
jgi:5'-methylthioadenosine phosphorylase